MDTIGALTLSNAVTLSGTTTLESDELNGIAKDVWNAVENVPLNIEFPVAPGRRKALPNNPFPNGQSFTS